MYKAMHCQSFLVGCKIDSSECLSPNYEASVVNVRVMQQREWHILAKFGEKVLTWMS